MVGGTRNIAIKKTEDLGLEKEQTFTTMYPGSSITVDDMESKTTSSGSLHQKVTLSNTHNKYVQMYSKL